MIILTRGLTQDTGSPGKNLTLDLEKLQVQPEVQAGFTDPEPCPLGPGPGEPSQRMDSMSATRTKHWKNWLPFSCAY